MKTGKTLHKRLAALAAAALMTAGTSMTGAASPGNGLKSQGNIKFENGTPGDASDDVLFHAEDLYYLNDRVEELITSITEGKGSIADAIKAKGSPENVSAASTFRELSDGIAGIGTAGTAGPGDVLSGKVYYDGTGYATGALENKSGSIQDAGVSMDNGTVTVSVPAEGYYDTDSKLVFNIGSAVSLDGNATAANVLSGSTFYSDGLTKQTGTMADNGAVNGTLNCGQSVTIPAGYTSGGMVAANSLESQTQATATADNISGGKTAWVNGQLVTGTGKDNNDYHEQGVKDGEAKPLSLQLHSSGYGMGIYFNVAAYTKMTVASPNSGGGEEEGVVGGVYYAKDNIVINTGTSTGYIFNGTVDISDYTTIGIHAVGTLNSKYWIYTVTFE